jgi:acetyl-CoA C-acetyltransferase
MPLARTTDAWIVSGLRSPFAKIDGALAKEDAISLSVPVVQGMMKHIQAGAYPDLVLWGNVTPNLGWSNIAREIWMDAKLDPRAPAASVVMACISSITQACLAAGFVGHGNRELAVVGGVEAMSRLQIGLGQTLSDWLRHVIQAKSLGQKIGAAAELKLKDIGLFIPAVANRTTGKSMGEHCEEMAKEWGISRKAQDELAYNSHLNAVRAQDAHFFDDLIVPVAGVTKDAIPRRDTTIEKLSKLPPSFDRTSGQGTLTAGNSTPLTDGAAGLWVASTNGLKKLDSALPRVRLVDFEITAVNIKDEDGRKKEGLLMAPSYAIPRLLARHNLKYTDIQLWEIHEAFAAQVLCNVAALESASFRKERAGVDRDFGRFPMERVNPNGGSLALGHPFAATGARDLSQAVKELARMQDGDLAIVSVCADGGQGVVALLEKAKN